MPDNQLAAGIVALRPFVPAKDFQTSNRFYTDLRFEIVPLGDTIAHVFDPARFLSHFAEEAT